MCGIVAGAGARDMAPIFLEGLHRLEYRGYDSAGLLLLDEQHNWDRLRVAGKVSALKEKYAEHPLSGHTGVAHTRWATHGQPTERNAHPHWSGERIGIVHNGIIENYQELKNELIQQGAEFATDTDTEVIAHLLARAVADHETLTDAVAAVRKRLRGAYALAVLDRQRPGEVVAVRHGCPLVLGIGIGEHFVASDIQALLPVTNRFVFLEEDDLVRVTANAYAIQDGSDAAVTRPSKEIDMRADAADRGDYRHYMEKEIHEQSAAVAQTLSGRVSDGELLSGLFGPNTETLLQDIQHVTIVACGTSWHAGLVARYWLESLAGVSVNVEVASEYRYRDVVVPPKSLFVCISQSGETADTLAALRKASESGYAAIAAICNVPESSIVRESDLVLLTQAGPEIGVASTKAFTTQLTALALLTATLGRLRLGDSGPWREMVAEFSQLADALDTAMRCEGEVARMAERIVHCHHALFLGRGVYFPIALEAALKLKEISYIHAEAYPAGELKHGPLALVDEDMPVIAVAPNDELQEKLVSNLQEVRARGGRLYLLAEHQADSLQGQVEQLVHAPTGLRWLAPIVLTVPFQLLAYHVAVLKGTDVDQPRNLAKSVTVE